MKIGEEIKLQTERMSYGAAAIARINGVVVFVTGAAPQEKVLARLTKSHKNFWEADCISILEPSPDRVQPKCSQFGFDNFHCGGCDWQHLSYESQLREKKAFLQFELSKNIQGNDVLKKKIKELIQVIPAAKPYAYRTRARFHTKGKDLGFYARKSHELIIPEKCEILDPRLQDCFTTYKQNVPFLTDEVELSIQPNGSIKKIENPKETGSFSQINENQNKILKKLIFDLASRIESKDTLLDLYAGSGNLSVDLKDQYKKIICVETVAQDDLPTHIEFHSKSVSDFLINYDETPSTVILDPPRSGISDILDDVLKLGAPHLIYVSCDPTTLSRDLKLMLNAYELETIFLLDMFPQTHHVETVVKLKKK